MGLLSTLGSIGSAILSSPITAKIGGSLASSMGSTIGSGIINTAMSAMGSGSSSSSFGQQSGTQGSESTTSSSTITGTGTESAASMSESGQTGSIQGIAGALQTALGTATGNNATSAGAFNAAQAATANDLQSKWWNNAALLNIGSNIIANLGNALSQTAAKRYNEKQVELERNYNAAEAAKAREWQVEQRGKTYQDTMRDMKKAGLNPILAAMQGGSAMPGTSGAASGAASIAAQGYGQTTAPGISSAHTGTMQAMYDYGNNTAQFLENMMQTINTAKQTGYQNIASSLQTAMTQGASASAKTISNLASWASGNSSSSSSYSNTSIQRENSRNSSNYQGSSSGVEGYVGLNAK